MVDVEELVKDVRVGITNTKRTYFLNEDSPSPVSPPTPYSPASPPDYDGPEWSGD
jgi:hypothetical protein